MFNFDRLSQKYAIDFSNVIIETMHSISGEGISSDKDYHVIILWNHEVGKVTEFLKQHGYFREANVTASTEGHASCNLYIKENLIKPKFNIFGDYPLGDWQWIDGQPTQTYRLDPCHAATPHGNYLSSDFFPFVFDWRSQELYNQSVFIMLRLYDAYDRVYLEVDDIQKQLNHPISKQAKYKVGILNEARGVYPEWSVAAEILLDNFDYVLAHDPKILSMSDKCLPCPWVGLFISEDPRTMNLQKSKLVSSIFSLNPENAKTMCGYQLRVDVYNKYRDSGLFDMYGNGINFIKKKEEGLKDYKFSIAIENLYGESGGAGEYYFTEKLLDCFATKTVPIYCGGSALSKWFDPKGVLAFETLEELDDILNNISDEMYEEMQEAIENNYNVLIEKFSSLQNFIYHEYPFLVK